MPRTKARACPSGETAEIKSNVEAGGLVNWRSSPVPMTIEKMPACATAVGARQMTSDLLYGIQLYEETPSTTLRSGPPIGEIRETVPLRKNAIQRPSGDQCGKRSTAGSVVRRSGVP